MTAPSAEDLFAAMLGRPTLFVDVDNVLCDLSSAVATALNVAFNTSYIADDFTVYEWATVLPFPQGKWLTGHLDDPVIYQNVSPIDGAVRTVRKARDAGYTVNIVTDRPERVSSATIGWLTRHNVPFDNIGFKVPGKTKAYYLEDNGPDNPAILIDDSPTYHHLIPRSGVEVWSPALPYVKDIPGIRVFSNWDEPRGWLGI